MVTVMELLILRLLSFGLHLQSYYYLDKRKLKFYHLLQLVYKEHKLITQVKSKFRL